MAPSYAADQVNTVVDKRAYYGSLRLYIRYIYTVSQKRAKFGKL